MEKELSVVNSTMINTAYNMLKSPTSRASYLVGPRILREDMTDFLLVASFAWN
jgi:hypothetical protein